MDRFAISTEEGKLPWEYVAHRLYSSDHYNPHNGRNCVRTIRLASKDVGDYLDTPKVRLNKKSGLLEADDENDNRPRGELWCKSILSATNPIEQIANEISKQNRLGALILAPDLVEGFLAIRTITQQNAGHTNERSFCEKSGVELHRLGSSAPDWLLDLSEEFIISSYVKRWKTEILAFVSVS